MTFDDGKMFINPPIPGVTVSESLAMGGRHSAVRHYEGITYVTTVIITRLEPAPPIYQVTSVAFREGPPGVRDYVREYTRSHDDFNEAVLDLITIHLTDHQEQE